RHTRFSRDWSSDVCSSDLGPERRFADKIIRLAEHRPAAGEKGLTSLERNAFREIGERLRKESEAGGEKRASPETETPKAAPTAEIGRASCRERGWMSGDDA